MKADILSKNLMIRASAGSGKTYQLGNRVIGLVGSKDIDPERIVALTFTRKAAGEFADSVLSKLAEAAVDDDARADLFEGFGQRPFRRSSGLCRGFSWARWMDSLRRWYEVSSMSWG